MRNHTHPTWVAAGGGGGFGDDDDATVMMTGWLWWCRGGEGDGEVVRGVVVCRLLTGARRKRGDDDIDGGSGRSEWSRADQ
ncbi:hypothetical protein Tco_1280264, partial [Tanacetum coccineum]